MDNLRSMTLATTSLALFAVIFWGGYLAWGIVALAALLWKLAF